MTLFLIGAALESLGLLLLLVDDRRFGTAGLTLFIGGVVCLTAILVVGI